MTHDGGPPLDPRISALLEAERDAPELPVEARRKLYRRVETSVAVGGSFSAVLAVSRTVIAFLARKSAVLAILAGGVSVIHYSATHRSQGKRGFVPRAPVPTAPSSPEGPSSSPGVPSLSDAPAPAVSPEPLRAPPLPVTRHRRDARPFHDADLARERGQLDLAWALVAQHRYAEGLAAVEEQARMFAIGRLGPEREAIAVQALTGLGRVREARDRADAGRIRYHGNILLPIEHVVPSRPE